MERRVRAKLLLRLVGILVAGLVLPQVVHGMWVAATAIRWSAIQSRIVFDIIKSVASQFTWRDVWGWALISGPATLAFAAALYLFLGGTWPLLRPIERRLSDG